MTWGEGWLPPFGVRLRVRVPAGTQLRFEEAAFTACTQPPCALFRFLSPSPPSTSYCIPAIAVILCVIAGALSAGHCTAGTASQFPAGAVSASVWLFVCVCVTASGSWCLLMGASCLTNLSAIP
mmetsp:Transcript_120503/g.209777  ORF Transcript_120503/g.209777 Transcript_120503/m.209777 type:complete len:124 (-) Transcript_120503:401-772(-)